MNLRLLPIRWLVLSKVDMDAILHVNGKPSFVGGYRHATSAQSLYYPAGTISEAHSINKELSSLETDYPNIQQVESTISQLTQPLEHYKFKTSDDIWHLIHQAPFNQDSPFAENLWVLIFEYNNEVIKLEYEGDELLEALSLMPFINGQHDLEALYDNLKGNSLALDLFQTLATHDLIETTENLEHNFHDYPSCTFLGHASFALRDSDDLLLIDPVLLPPNESLGCINERCLFGVLEKSSAILISHHHWDHLHFQTLARISKDKPFIVPAVAQPTFANPSIAQYLRSLGFSNITEVQPWQTYQLGNIIIRFAEFLGETFGLNSEFSGLTYHVSFSNQCLYGSVDACFNESGDMTSTFKRVAEWGKIDYFAFGSSGQTHEVPFLAAGLRYFSNELKNHPQYLKYHPNVDDVIEWVPLLKPSYLLPYAEFLFGGIQVQDIKKEDLRNIAETTLITAQKHLKSSNKQQWLDKLSFLSAETQVPLVLLQPSQGIH